MTRCERGRVFFSPEDLAGTVYFLKEGRVRLYRSDEEGRNLTVAVLDPGAVFGVNALLGQNLAGVYASADEECILCVMPAAHLQMLIGEVPQVGLNLLQFVGAQLQQSQVQAEKIAFHSVRQRLAGLLIELDARYGRPTLDGTRIIDKTFTQQDLASMIGATRETVGELMSRWKRNELISSRKRKIIIVDPVRLTGLRDGDKMM